MHRWPRLPLLAAFLVALSTAPATGQKPIPPAPDHDPSPVVLPGEAVQPISLETLFFEAETAGVPPPLGLLPGVPRDFRRPDSLEPSDPNFDPGAPYASFTRFQPLEITDPEGSGAPGPYPSGTRDYLFTVVSFRGPTMRSLREGQEIPPPEVSIASVAEVKQARLTAEVWIPGPASSRPLSQQIRDLDPGDPDTFPLVVVAGTGFSCFQPATLEELGNGPDPGAGKAADDQALLGRELAARGILYVRVREGDDCLDPDGPAERVLPLPQQFGYPGENPFALQSREALRQRGARGLMAEDLRLDSRYEIAQQLLLARTFLQHYILEKLATMGPLTGGPVTEAETEAWLRTLTVIYSGGSKGGAAALTAAGADDRAVGVDASGFQGFDAGEEGPLRRFRTDWCERPGQETVGIRTPDRNIDFASWVFRNRGVTPSYAQVYLPSHDPRPERYRKLLIVDTVSTHDHNWPLASGTRFWREHDGLDDLGLPDPGEVRWPARHVRNPNLGHGLQFVPFSSLNPRRLDSRFLSVYNLALHLAGLRPHFPSMETVEVDLPASCSPNCPPGQECWSVRIRLDQLSDAIPLSRERYRVYLLFSDDRDTRRFDGDGLCSTEPLENRVEESAPRASILHRTGNDEDYFIRVDDPVVLNEDASGAEVGETPAPQGYRRLRFCPPKQILSFPTAPMIAVTVELWIDENDDGEVGLGETSRFTEVELVNVPPLDPVCDPPVVVAQVEATCPTSGLPGQQVLLYGRNFVPESVPYLRDDLGLPVPVVNPTLISEGLIRFLVPSIPAGPSYRVCVDNGTLSCGPLFAVEPPLRGGVQDGG